MGPSVYSVRIVFSPWETMTTSVWPDYESAMSDAERIIKDDDETIDAVCVHEWRDGKNVETYRIDGRG